MKINKILLIAFASMFTLTINQSIANEAYDDDDQQFNDENDPSSAPGQNSQLSPKQQLKSQYKDNKRGFKQSYRASKLNGISKAGRKAAKKDYKSNKKRVKRDYKDQKRQLRDNFNPQYPNPQNFPPQDMQYAGSRSNFN